MLCPPCDRMAQPFTTEPKEILHLPDGKGVTSSYYRNRSWSSNAGCFISTCPSLCFPVNPPCRFICNKAMPSRKNFPNRSNATSQEDKYCYPICGETKQASTYKHENFPKKAKILEPNLLSFLHFDFCLPTFDCPYSSQPISAPRPSFHSLTCSTWCTMLELLCVSNSYRHEQQCRCLSNKLPIYVAS